MTFETMDALFLEFLRLSATLRPSYPDSLGKADPDHHGRIAAFWPSQLPELVNVIYSRVSGTRSKIENQALMDFVPGYRLLHIDELARAYQTVKRRWITSDLFPILGNYSSDFIVLRGGMVAVALHEGSSVSVMHRSSEAFLETACEFYRRAVFFLDGDGFLDYSFEEHGRCGSELNPEMEYWVE